MKTLLFIIAIGFTWSVAKAQDFQPFSYNPGKTYQLSVDGQWFRSSLSGQSIFFSSMNGRIFGNNWDIGGTLRFNNNQVFSLVVPGRLFELPDSSEVVDLEGIENKPDIYEYSWPLSLSGSFNFDYFHIYTSLHWLNQQVEIQEPVLKSQGNKLYYIDWTSTNKTKASLTGQLHASVPAGFVTFFAGFSAVPLYSTGKLNYQYEIQPVLQPDLWIRGSWSAIEIETGSLTGTFFTRLSIPWRFDWLPMSGPAALMAKAAVPVSGYSFTDWQFSVRYPVSNFVDVFTAGRWVVHADKKLAGSNFPDMLEIQGRTTDPVTPHQSIGIGIRFKLDPSFRENPVRLVGQKVFQTRIFTAKKAWYSFNPVATLDIHNSSPDAEAIQIVARAGKSDINYQSESFVLNGNEIRSVPVYLYPGNNTNLTGSVNDQVEILLIRDGRETALTSVPVTVYDANSWEGNTWDLRFFLTPQAPEIISFGKSVYLEVTAGKSTASDNPQLDKLKLFLDKAGKNLSYIPDPSTSTLTDRVQYPVETLEKSGGDCEDLVIYLASVLMSVGYDCALVDLRPSSGGPVTVPTANPGSIGHVFLLVDTGIPVSMVGNTGLNDYQAIPRKNALGETTVWIPIEATVIRDGFEKAFQEGVKQYYEEVILRDGVQNGQVFIYDF